MKISVVIPAHDNQRLLDNSLRSIDCQRDQLHEIIVVDDASATPLTVPDWCEVIRIRRKAGHRGSSAAKNLGASLATGDYLSFCDSDILHLPDAFASLAAHMKMWEDDGSHAVLVNTARVSLPRDKELIADSNPPEEILADCRAAGILQDEPLHTSYMCYEQNESLIRKDTFDALGGYDEAGFPHWGFNNQDLGLRLTNAGGRVCSAIRRVTTGLRLYCFHQWHENDANIQRGHDEFIAKWGEDFTGDMMRRAMNKASGVAA